jgi:gamma-butyrobetaine dioxygenase
MLQRCVQPLERIAMLFEREGAHEYSGEAVSVSVHMLQAGALAEAGSASDHLVAAALLHDVGHLRSVASGRGDHEESGARWLAHWLPPEVTEPVRLHVAAKRYLCATEPNYAARLSAASALSLVAQGGPMSSAEARAFERLPYAQAALAVRRWDEAAKDADATAPSFDHFHRLLTRVMGARATPA